MFLTEAPPAPSSEAPDGRRAGATWVAATGAFLLVAAAAVFIAVRWDTLPEAAKLALVGALTGGFLVGGRALRRTLPATGDVLFHLGAFLLPVDVAGLCVRADLGWRNLVLGEGLLGVGVLGALGAATGSVVLAWAAGASMVVLALGVAAVSPLPAPLVLAAAAAVAHLVGRRRSAIGWAATAGLAPVLATGVANVLANLSGRDLGAGTLADLGLAGATAALFAVASGVVSAAVLGREAHRQQDLALVALAGVSLLAGAGTTWAAADPSTEAALLTAPSVFLSLQLLAMLARRDPFWRRPSTAVAIGSEVIAALVAPLAALIVLFSPSIEQGLDLFGDSAPWTPEPVASTAWLLLAAGWLVAGWRRQSSKPTVLAAARAALADDRTVAFAALAVAAAVVVGTASTFAFAAALLAMGAVLFVTGGILATVGAALAVVWAPVVLITSHPAAVLPVAVVAVAVLVGAARRHRGATTVALTAAASIVALGSGMHGVDRYGVAASLLTTVVLAWAAALVVERASAIASQVARVAQVLAVAAAFVGSDAEVLAVSIAATLLLLVDAVRRDEPMIAFGATLTGPAIVLAAAGVAGLTMAETGVVLAGAAVVLGGMAALTPERWRLPVLAAAATSLGVGLPLAAADGARLAEAIILAGGLVIAIGVSLRNNIAAHAGGAIVTIGIAIHLGVDGVTATEPFLLPVALQLVVLGVQLRRRAEDPPSSWTAFGPAIALLGGAAMAERVQGGAAWHALVAGAIGVVAVAVGGWKRLAAPLLLGTALIVTVTTLETLHTLTGVPTWAWLAAGGTVLLATGVLLERTATSPSEAGRRLVDVVGERFE
jgi:hypothetical protein